MFDIADFGALSREYVEGLWQDYVRDPASVPQAWREWFRQSSNGAPPSPDRTGPSFPRRSLFHPAASPATTTGNGWRPGGGERRVAVLQDRVDQLIRSYRVRGHIVARIDPLGVSRAVPLELDPGFHGLSAEQFDRVCSTKNFAGPDEQTLAEIVARLHNTYCRSIGVQFMHIDDEGVRNWLQERMESTENRLALSKQEQQRILTRLTDAAIFEEFVRKKYVGAKTFSLEGAESLIPLLDMAIDRASSQGVTEIVIGMAHRGRLNVLANIMGKRPSEIFREFEAKNPLPESAGGDVKYHLGHSHDWTTSDGRTVHLSLCFNPSHLEFVNPVACGRMRAKQDRAKDAQRERGMVLLVHGDAAFAGEGVVQETLNMSQLAGYAVGGTLHVVVNNQLGFTTGPDEGRSTAYATDVAKMLQSPIFHVNGEDPESVAQVVSLSLDFRRKFRRDVVIDMYCYRRWGHNEGDEPAFTQPVLYQAVERRPSVRQAYLECLLKSGEITSDEADEIAARRRAVLESEFEQSEKNAGDGQAPKGSLTGAWKGDYVGGPDSATPDVDTGVPLAQLTFLLGRLASLPEGFQPHRKLQRWLRNREEMAAGRRPLDWSAAEALAFASLAAAGNPVRLSGQDAQRGTFSHRHAVLHDERTDRTYAPLAHLTSDQAPVDLINSPLSEAGVLGFDYGYSLDRPNALVCWEAQFGDFWNAAQVIVDQFIASAEEKWRRLSGIALLLPHGFEGQGPEHSSARIERFLNLAARDNVQIVVPTTPAQYFHALRRQVIRPWRKPLIVIAPKGLLRHPQAISPLEACAGGRFQRVLPDEQTPPTETKRVLLCCGRIFYELFERRTKLQRTDVQIVRLEQLYPLPLEQLATALANVPQGTEVRWVQEEPENMGAWQFLRWHAGERLLDRFPLTGVARPASASPATGSMARHKLQQESLLTQAFE